MVVAGRAYLNPLGWREFRNGGSGLYFDWRLWRMTEGLRGRILGCVALGLLALAAGIARFAFVGLFLAGVFDGADFTALLKLLAASAAAILLRAGLDHARIVLAHASSARVQAMLRARLYDRIVALGPAWFAGERTGGVMLSMIDGVEQLQTFFGQYLPQVCVAAFAPLAIFLFMAWWDVPVACVLLGAALFTLVLPAAVHRSDRSAALERGRNFKQFGEEFLDAMQGLPSLKAFGQSAAYGRRLAAKARALSDSTLRVLGLSILSGAHNTVFPKIWELMKQKKMDDVLLTGGGIMPDDDMQRLNEMGVGKLFAPGATTTEIALYIKDWVKQHRDF